MDLKQLNPFGFPGGERHIETANIDTDDVLAAHIRTSDDLMDLLLATDVLQARGLQPKTLRLPYVPYARQDRRTTPHSPFSLKVFAKLINGLGYSRVQVYEPHSIATQALIDNCEVVPLDDAAIQFVTTLSNTSAQETVLMAPDAGAVQRVSRIADRLGLPMAVAIKKRDPATGHLRIVDVFGSWQGKSIIVVDDICDGGATFVQLAEHLAAHSDNSHRCSLFVAHGIFSKGLDQVSKFYHSIGTTDSFCESTDSRLTIYQCWP